MNRNLLTLLSCSSSLLMVCAANPAKAILPPGTLDNASKVDVLSTSQPTSSEQAPQASIQTQGDRVKQLAASIFGCTCANCVNAVQQMIQQGSLQL